MALIGYPTTRDHIPDLLEANVRKSYLDTSSKMPKLYRKIYNINSSNKKIERDVISAGYGTYEAKDEGQPPQFDSGQEAWTQSYTHLTYALGAQVTREAIEDDLHGVIRWLTRIGGGLSEVAWYTKDRDSMSLFNTLLTSGTAYTAGGSNYPVLSTTHFRIDGGTWSNRPANAMDLSIEALEFMLSHWMVNQVNQRGQVIFDAPQRLLVGASDGPLAQRLLGSVKQPQGNDNDPNVVRGQIGEVIVHPLLTNDGRWLAFGPKERTGLNYFERVAPNVEKWAETTTGNLQIVGRYRASWGIDFPSYTWGSP